MINSMACSFLLIAKYIYTGQATGLVDILLNKYYGNVMMKESVIQFKTNNMSNKCRSIIIFVEMNYNSQSLLKNNNSKYVETLSNRIIE